jgi:hypothetical protein
MLNDNTDCNLHHNFTSKTLLNLGFKDCLVLLFSTRLSWNINISYSVWPRHKNPTAINTWLQKKKVH